MKGIYKTSINEYTLDEINTNKHKKREELQKRKNRRKDEKERMIEEFARGKIGEFYVSEDKFTVGSCMLDSENAVLIEAIDPQGKWDGYYWFKKNTLTEVNYDTKYLNKIELYREYWNNNHDNCASIKLSDLSINIIDLIKIAKQNNVIITIRRDSEEELDTGFVTSIDGNSIKMECINLETAELLETIDVEIDKINFLEIDSPDNRLLEYAYLKKKND
ncbi:hypothetical protein [Lachnobacterium bovis]|uniref:hypothetical protein n=1 Tax=Lachnobacterium bovis TaxID=140626 RepID=UPI0003B36007|nr:hypothetical protein [Lachnobacterium bovis]